MKAEEQELKDCVKPIGDFILNRSDINSKAGVDGFYYHYSDVCKLLKEYARIHIEKDRQKISEEFINQGLVGCSDISSFYRIRLVCL